MVRQHSLFLGSTVLAATLALTASAQEYSNGTGQCGRRGRGPATSTPVEAFGVHPPGPDPAYNRKCFFRRWRFTFTPYYAPVSPTASSVRWKPWCYFPLMPYYTPYYCAYCPKRLHNPKPLPYGYDGGWGEGPKPEGPIPDDPSGTPLRYGGYTSIIQDDTIFWNMGGNALVPYGAPRPPHLGPPDLVDGIQATRAAWYGGGCQLAPDGAPLVALKDMVPPPIMPSELPDEKSGDMGDKASKGASGKEKSAQPE